VCEWFTSGWLRITIQIESCGSSTCTSRSLHRFRSITSKCSRIARTSIHQGWRRTECGLDTILLVGTGRAWAAYHRGATIRLCPALYLYGVVTIWYWINNEEQLSQPVSHPEEPVDELAYVPHSHQNIWVISIELKYFFLLKLFT
jgi:hypothetical protein